MEQLDNARYYLEYQELDEIWDAIQDSDLTSEEIQKSLENIGQRQCEILNIILIQ
jgi:hypothetical protein